MKTELTEQQLEEVKAWKQEWFKPNFEIGKWYSDGECLFLFNGEYDKEGDPKGYGFLTYNYKYDHWTNEVCTGWDKNFKWNEAKIQEVKEALLKEAEKRGYDKGVKIRTRGGNYHILSGVNFSTNTTSLIDTDFCGTYIFHEGEWCEIISSASDIHTDIQALKDKYTDFNWTIIAEKK